MPQSRRWNLRPTLDLEIKCNKSQCFNHRDELDQSGCGRCAIHVQVPWVRFCLRDSLTASCSQSKESEYTMNKILHDHTPFAQACMLTITNMHACTLNLTRVRYTYALHTHTYIQLLIVKNESSLIL